jgi:hypothetical protein
MFTKKPFPLQNTNHQRGRDYRGLQGCDRANNAMGKAVFMVELEARSHRA